jgi:hypothetical protein
MENYSSSPIHALMTDVMDECFPLFKMLAAKVIAMG